MFVNCVRSLFFVLVLAGCVSSDAEDALSVQSDPLGAAKKDGDYPNINEVPTGQTKQLTAAEKTVIKRDLSNSVEKPDPQAAQESQKKYLEEVKAMQKLAKEAEKKQLADIESRKY